MDYGKALRITRAISGIQQKELAELTGFDPSYISLVEKGKRRPSLRAVRVFSTALKVPHSLFTMMAMEPEDAELEKSNDLSQLGETFVKLVVSAKIKDGREP